MKIAVAFLGSLLPILVSIQMQHETIKKNLLSEDIRSSSPGISPCIVGNEKSGKQDDAKFVIPEMKINPAHNLSKHLVNAQNLAPPPEGSAPPLSR